MTLSFNQSTFLGSSLLGMVLTLVLLLSSSSSVSFAKSPAGRTVEMKVFYVTDRRPGKKGYGNDRLKHPEVRYGVLSKTVKWKDLSHGTKFDEGKRNARWANNVQPDDDLDLENFMEQLATARKQTKAKDVLIYIHGFNNSFEVATHTAAKLSFEFGTPVVSYAWATPIRKWPRIWTLRVKRLPLRFPFFLAPPVMDSYRESEVTSMASQERFRDFLNKVRSEFGSNHVILLAHSMGSRILEETLIQSDDDVSDDKKLKQVIFSNPDTDGSFFLSHAKRIREKTRMLRIFYSRRDEAMSASRALHGDHFRLGQTENIEEELSEYANLYDVTKMGRDVIGGHGHAVPIWVISQIYKHGDAPTSVAPYYEWIRGSKSNCFSIEKK